MMVFSMLMLPSIMLQTPLASTQRSETSCPAQLPCSSQPGVIWAACERTISCSAILASIQNRVRRQVSQQKRRGIVSLRNCAVSEGLHRES